MKIVFKIVSVIIVAAFALCAFAACGSESYRDDVSVSDIANAVNSGLSGLENLDEIDENYISVQQKLPLDGCLEYIEMVQTGGIGIDEYGIFKMKDAESAEAMRAAVESYLERARAAFNENYAPNERPKIDSADVKVCGNYVMYAVLSDSEREASFSTFESALKK